MKNSVNLVEFALDEAVRKYVKNTDLVKEINRSVIPLLSSIQGEMLRSEMVSLSSKKTGIPEKSIWADLERFNKNKKYPAAGNSAGKPSHIEPLNLLAEEMLAGIILLGNDEIEKKLQNLVGRETVSEIISNGRLDKDTLIFETEARLAGLNIENVANELLERIERGILEKKLSDTARLLDATIDAGEKEKLKKEATDISKRIADLNK